MLNLAGSSYDFGNVLFAVLQECEHRRRALLPNEAEQGLMDIARRKLEEVRASYEEAGGSRPYWEDLEREVLKTTMPQYVPAAIEQTRLEQSNYDLWRRGDVAARAAFALLGLVIGALIVWAPFIPIWEKWFAFLLAALAFAYPEIKKAAFDFRHSRFLNNLITQAEEYQKNSRIHYVTTARLEEEFRSLGTAGEPVAAERSAEPREGLRLVQNEPPEPPRPGKGQRTRG
jgi:hypothetical protein